MNWQSHSRQRNPVKLTTRYWSPSRFTESNWREHKWKSSNVFWNSGSICFAAKASWSWSTRTHFHGSALLPFNSYSIPRRPSRRYVRSAPWKCVSVFIAFEPDSQRNFVRWTKSNHHSLHSAAWIPSMSPFHEATRPLHHPKQTRPVSWWNGQQTEGVPAGHDLCSQWQSICPNVCAPEDVHISWRRQWMLSRSTCRHCGYHALSNVNSLQWRGVHRK